MAISIIQTKFHRPPQRKRHVHRRGLMDLLDEGLWRPLTLVSAPAGYGKSTLISCWLGSREEPSAWISLEDADSDLVSFLTYFVAGVRTVFPKACPGTEALLETVHVPPAAALAGCLTNELEALQTPFILALDDYGRIHEPVVHEMLGRILEHPPPRLHLVIMTRRDPPLPLSAMRAGDRVTEIRVQDLQFTAPETAAFLEQAVQRPMSESTVAKMQKEMEGWVAGLQLASLAVRHHEDPDGFLSALHGDIQYVREYLIGEVLRRRSSVEQDWLMKTSILDRFCPALCEAVCIPDREPGMSDFGGEDFLQTLKQGDLFTIALDSRNEWHRYHHLFQQLLQDRLKRHSGPDDIAALHDRASKWFASENLIEEAIDHALVAGDAMAAAQVVERNRLVTMDAERWYVLPRWLERLPPEIKRERPELLLTEAWAFYQQFRLAEVPPLLERIEALLDHDSVESAVLGELNFLWAFSWLWQGEPKRSLELLDWAQERIPEAPSSLRWSEIQLYRALALYISGQEDAAVLTIKKGVRNGHSGEGMLWTRLLISKVFIHLLSGDLSQTAQEAMRLGEGGRRSGNLYIEAWGEYLQGNAFLQSFDLNAAHHHFDLATKQRYVLHTRASIDAMAGLAITCQLMGQPDQADQTMRAAVEFAQWTNDPDKLEIVRSCGARLALLRGDLEAAARWQQSFNGKPDGPGTIFFVDTPCITECRVLVALGSDASLREATEKLGYLWQATSDLHYTGQMVEIVVLQAVALDRQGRPDEALELMERAVALSWPGRWIRPYVELGPPMANLLRRLASRNIRANYVGEILAAFRGEAAPPSRNTRGLTEPLTVREEEILALLGQRRRDKEIAQELVVSTETVKTHLRNLYSKLGVSNRLEAVARATELGILPRS